MTQLPQKLNFIADAGHAWLAVPAELVQAYGLTPSSFSYYNEGYYYLEEDCDATRFINAVGKFVNNSEKAGKVDQYILTHDGQKIQIGEIYDGEYSKIRSFQNAS